MSEPWTEEQIREINAEMADGLIREIGETLAALGCCHGHDMSSTPPMFYPETIRCAVAHAYERGRGGHACHNEE